MKHEQIKTYGNENMRKWKHSKMKTCQNENILKFQCAFIPKCFSHTCFLYKLSFPHVFISTCFHVHMFSFHMFSFAHAFTSPLLSCLHCFLVPMASSSPFFSRFHYVRKLVHWQPLWRHVFLLQLFFARLRWARLTLKSKNILLHCNFSAISISAYR